MSQSSIWVANAVRFAGTLLLLQLGFGFDVCCFKVSVIMARSQRTVYSPAVSRMDALGGCVVFSVACLVSSCIHAFDVHDSALKSLYCVCL